MNRWNTKSEHIQWQQQCLGFTWKGYPSVLTHSLQISMIYDVLEGWFVAGFFQSTYMQSPFRPISLHKSITVSTYNHERVHLVRNWVGFHKQKACHMSKLSFILPKLMRGNYSQQLVYFVQINKGLRDPKTMSVYSEILSDSWDTAVVTQLTPCAFERLRLNSYFNIHSK